MFHRWQLGGNFCRVYLYFPPDKDKSFADSKVTVNLQNLHPLKITVCIYMVAMLITLNLALYGHH